MKCWNPLRLSSLVYKCYACSVKNNRAEADNSTLVCLQIQHIEPDLCVLIINDAITKDEGLYSVSARNIAGSISSSVMLRVEESESDYGYLTYSRGRNVKPKTKLLGDFYDLGDELGRGTQGITYHAVERLSGKLHLKFFLAYASVLSPNVQHSN